MDLREGAFFMMAIGIGCKAGTKAEAIIALVETALARVENDKIAGLFTIAEKTHEAGLHEAAARLSLPLMFLPETSVKNVACKAETRSERVVHLFGVPSVAETAALAGAGDGATLILPRISEGGVTCAIAQSGGPSS
jgi:cobalt-precorrin 5A hydrolase